MVESSKQKIKIAIIGASGAIGREILRALKASDEVEEVSLIVRRKLPEWEVSEFKPNLKLI